MAHRTKAADAIDEACAREERLKAAWKRRIPPAASYLLALACFSLGFSAGHAQPLGYLKPHYGLLAPLVRLGAENGISARDTLLVAYVFTAILAGLSVLERVARRPAKDGGLRVRTAMNVLELHVLIAITAVVGFGFGATWDTVMSAFQLLYYARAALS